MNGGNANKIGLRGNIKMNGIIGIGKIMMKGTKRIMSIQKIKIHNNNTNKIRNI
jgi:hypothetical protein